MTRLFRSLLVVATVALAGVPIGETEAAPGGGGGGPQPPPKCPPVSSATQIVDSDHDGISDCHETRIYGTNPNSWDTDGDGMSDDGELFRFGSNPLVADPDSDADGLADPLEVSYGLPPLDADADDDGITDQLDAVGACHGGFKGPYAWALDPDIDDDGLTDGEEWFKVGTNCLLVDTDQDGYADGTEIGKGTDPLDPFSYPGA